MAEPGIILSPGVLDCLSAKITERTGFEVVFTAGFGISGSVLGYSDYGLLTATEMLNAAGNISKSVDIPLLLILIQAMAITSALFAPLKTLSTWEYQELDERFSTRKPPQDRNNPG